MAGTLFSAIYNRFLGKITDDMYLELTPQDTLRDLQRLLVDAIPGFEFPRHNIYDYTIDTTFKNAEDISEDDFIISGIIWQDIGDDSSNVSGTTSDDSSTTEDNQILVDNSYFAADLTSEEINILACLMKQGWVQRQVSSIENTRMKYSGSDFKMTSQANHLQKLLSLLEESRRESFHMQRLYKRRKVNDDGTYVSNWGTLNHHSTHLNWTNDNDKI